MTERVSIEDISPSLLVRYLKGRGWTANTLTNGLQHLTQENGQFEILLHLTRQYESLPEEIYFAIRTVADYYDKDINHVVQEIRSHLSDRISGRIPDQYVSNDSIEFRVAKDYVTGMRDFLASSATTELTESRHFYRTLKEASQFTDNCRFGHTFRGSFGFVIESPVELNETPSLEVFEEALPLGRRVVERIVNGFDHIQLAAQNNDPTYISREDSGLSANMCDALADLVEEVAVSQISFGIDLSTEWKSTSSGTAQCYEVAQSSLEVIRSAAISLRSEEKPTTVEIVGRIRRVATDGVPSDLLDDKAKREIELNWISEDDRIVHIKLNVSPEEYLTAVEAHKNGKYVKVKGLLPATGKTRSFVEHGPITVLNT